MPTPEEIAAEKATAEQADADKATTEEAKVEAEKAAAEKSKEVQDSDETVEIKSIVKDAEGNFVWIADPTDPKSTVYKGKDIDELLANAGKGIKEKDSYIGKLKSEGLIASKPRVEPEAKTEFPEYGVLLDAVMKELRVDPKLLQYTDEDWKAVEEQMGVRKALRLEQTIQQAKQIADQRYAEANVAAINESTLDEETEAIADILRDFGVPEDTFVDTFKDILTRVMNEPNNFNKQGVRKNGRVVAAATKEIRKIVEGKTAGIIQKKTDEEIARARVLKAGIKSDGPTRQAFNKPTEKEFKSTEDVVADILKELKK